MGADQVYVGPVAAVVVVFEADDVDGSGAVVDAGDLEGVQVFELGHAATWRMRRPIHSATDAVTASPSAA